MTSSLTLAAADPVAHVINHPYVVNEDGWWIWSSSQTNLVISGLVLVVLGLLVAKAVSTGPESQGHDRYTTRNPFLHMIEVICTYLKDKTITPLLGKRADAMAPFLWTLFFFILVNNLLGMIPLLDAWHLANPADKEAHMSFIGGTATQSIYVTGVLALLSAVVINAAGVKELGLGGYLKHLTAGAPVFVWPIIIPLEILGTLIKPAALAIRLFANMTAGHILVAVLLSFAGDGFASASAIGIPIGIVALAGTLAIYFLEIFIAFLQAYVFMFLTTVFISLLEHHHDHDHEHAKHIDADSELHDLDEHGVAPV
jgi:F-type H+-transporting ATPase subunit a